MGSAASTPGPRRTSTSSPGLTPTGSATRAARSSTGRGCRGGEASPGRPPGPDDVAGAGFAGLHARGRGRQLGLAQPDGAGGGDRGCGDRWNRVQLAPVLRQEGMSLKLGWKASAEQFGPRQLLDYAVEAEEQGFDSVMVSDHYQPWRHTDGHAPFSMSWLAAVGERTKRVQLGTSVLTPTFRYHPAVVAHAFATLGSLYPGRIILGIGTGESMNEVPVS